MDITFFFLLTALVVLSIFTFLLKKTNTTLEAQNDSLKQELSQLNVLLKKYSSISEPEKYISQLEKSIEELEVQKTDINQTILEIINQKQLLLAELSLLEEKSFLEDFGFYEMKYNFESSTDYQAALDAIRNTEKDLLKLSKAAICSLEWSVGGSRSEGKKMTKEQLRLMLRAFNGECDAAVAKVRYNNINTMETRIQNAFDKINALGKTSACSITNEYLQTKLKELSLIYEFQEKKQQEVEEQRSIRQQMREEEQALKELEKAQREAEKDEERYQKALEKAREEFLTATDKGKSALEDRIRLLEENLKRAHEQKERAISRAQMTKSGHVYIISNIGSFGEHIYKIGMTRRLEPMDRVKELGDASVPFSFDVHAFIFSENAPEMENLLHKKFHLHRVNQINERKEFFKVSLHEIENAVFEIAQQNPIHNSSQIEFTRIAEAEQYRQTVAKLASLNT